MDAITAILERRSIRRGFDGGAVDDHALATILECGCAAPSSKDEQPWVIHAVRDKALLASISDAMIDDPRAMQYVPLDSSSGQPHERFDSSVRESAQVLRSVGLALFIEDDCSFSGGRGRLHRCGRQLPEALLGYAFEIVGVAAAVQNMWLAAHALGLAGVFIGDVVIAEPLVKSRLALQGDLIGVLALGRSDAPPHAPRRQLGGRAVIHPSAT
jgi:nitroreductase